MLRVALVGVGGISPKHIGPWTAMEDVELVALCDIRPERMEKYPDVHHYTDYKEMLEIEKPDILDICVEDGTLNIRQKSYYLRAETLEVRIPHYDYSAIATSGGSDFEWDNCNVESLVIATSGGADIEISGLCKQLTVAASGGADLDLEELIAECVEVSISGGADAGVHATNSLTINASGGADIYYTGNPSTTDINTSGGASVSRND
jgi:hypothetical protein